MAVLSLSELREVLPRSLGKGMTEESVLDLARSLESQENIEAFREGFISYRNVLESGKFTTAEYINAVKFMMYRSQNFTKQDSWKFTFPEKVERLTREGRMGQLSSYVAAYSRSRLVELMTKQMAIPLYLLNMDAPQEAINRLLKTIRNPKASDRDANEAARVLLDKLAPPTEAKVSIEVGVKHDDEYTDMLRSISETAARQQRLIELGMASAQSTAEDRIVGEAQYHEL